VSVSKIANDVPMEITGKNGVAARRRRPGKNFPITRSMREMGLEKEWSPSSRALSPPREVNRRYIAPVMHKIITVYPMKLPNVAPLTFFRRRHILLFIENGDSTDAGRCFAASRSLTTVSR